MDGAGCGYGVVATGDDTADDAAGAGGLDVDVDVGVGEAGTGLEHPVCRTRLTASSAARTRRNDCLRCFIFITPFDDLL